MPCLAPKCSSSGDSALRCAGPQCEWGNRKGLPLQSGIASEIIREIFIPEIEKEVNEGKTFANLRQIYHSLILATWYKKNLKQSLLGQVYVDKNKTRGVDVADKTINEKIYNQYVEAFKKGEYDFIKEDYDPATQEIVPRKYFSGGMDMAELSQKTASAVYPSRALQEELDASQLVSVSLKGIEPDDNAQLGREQVADVAMTEPAKQSTDLDRGVVTDPGMISAREQLLMENLARIIEYYDNDFRSTGGATTMWIDRSSGRILGFGASFSQGEKIDLEYSGNEFIPVGTGLSELPIDIVMAMDFFNRGFRQIEDLTVSSRKRKTLEDVQQELTPDMTWLLNSITKEAIAVEGERPIVVQPYGEHGYYDKLHKEDLEEIYRVLTQNRYFPPYTKNAEPVYVSLQHPFVNRHGETITAVHIKRIDFDQRLTLKPHEGSGVVDYHFRSTAEGMFTGNSSYGTSPQAAMIYKSAVREFLSTHLLHNHGAFNKVAHVKTPLAIGYFPEAILYEGQPLGFVMLGVSEAGKNRLNIRRLFSKLPAVSKPGELRDASRWGQVLRAIHQAGAIHYFLHDGNLSMFGDDLPVVHDLHSMQHMTLNHLTEAQFMALQFGDLYYVMKNIHYMVWKTNQEPYSAWKADQDPLNLFLNGYFDTNEFTDFGEAFWEMRAIFEQSQESPVSIIQQSNSPIVQKLKAFKDQAMGSAKKPVFLIMGLTGSGKGTVGKMLSQKMELKHVSMGELVRLNVPRERRLQEKTSGKDRIKILIREILNNADVYEQGLILDINPESTEYLQALLEALKEKGFFFAKLIHVDSTEENALERTIQRAMTRAQRRHAIISFNLEKQIRKSLTEFFYMRRQEYLYDIEPIISDYQKQEKVIQLENNADLIRLETAVDKVLPELEQAKDEAMEAKEMVQQTRPGGIDLNPNLFTLQKQGEWVKFDVPDPISIQQMNIEGFVPVIIRITPVTNVPLLLGLHEEGGSQEVRSNPERGTEPMDRKQWLQARGKESIELGMVM